LGVGMTEIWFALFDSFWLVGFILRRGDAEIVESRFSKQDGH